MNFFGKTSLDLREAILASLVYYDLFSYPLTLDEIWFWLPKEASLKDIFWELNDLIDRGLVFYQEPFYFLGSETIIGRRCRRERTSEQKLVRAKIIARELILLPWVDLVAISGNLAMKSAGEGDDIDLLILAQSGCLYRARLASILLTELLGQRRRPGQKQAPDKVCLNIFLEANNLVLPKDRHDFYTAHEALQLAPIIGNNNLYRRFLVDNDWLIDYLPQAYQNRLEKLFFINSPASDNKRAKTNWLEKVAGFVQLAYSKSRQRQLTKDNDNRQLFFHPQDQRQIVLDRFKKNWEKIIKAVNSKA